MGQCLVDLERWEDAYVQFKVLYDATVAFEKETKDVELPMGTPVLDKTKLARWLEKIRPHVPDLAMAGGTEPTDGAAPGQSISAPFPLEEALAANTLARLPPQNLLDAGASLLGRDADFAWFRFVIPAKKVMRDDSPTGAHDFIPLEPGISFPTTRQEIYLVFGLVTASYDEVPLAARCFKETSELNGEATAVSQDHLIMSTNDQSGYFFLSRPAPGWTPGLYRCGLFAGEQTSAYSQVDEVRFRIVEPLRPS